MTKYKVKVPWLNVRKYPVADFKINNIITVVPQGLIIDAEEVTEYPNPYLGKWYKDSKNQYYNEIGLELFSDAQLAKSIKIDFNPSIDHWWIKDYGIDKVWRHTKGAGVKIAVIDSGLDYNHTNIKNKNNISYYNLLNGSTDKTDCLDETTHGTMCAGMIGAHGPELFGVAPEADLLIIKATKDGDLEFENLPEAIEKAVQLKANIISISFDMRLLPDDPTYSLLQDAVRKASEKNILIVASVGNTGLANSAHERYPASFIHSLSVGSCNKDKSISEFNTANINLDILAPGEDVALLGENNTIIFSQGSSYAVPFVAGVCALYLSYSKSNNIEFLKSSLKQDSINKEEVKAKLTTAVIPNLGVINLKKLFNY